MTEINIYSAGDNSKKTQAKKQTRQANQLSEIEIFGGKTEGSGTPYNPKESKLPSIFDDNSFKPKKIKGKKETPPGSIIGGKNALK